MILNEIVVLSDGETFSGIDADACVIVYDENLVGNLDDARDIPESAIVKRVSIADLLDCWEKFND